MSRLSAFRAATAADAAWMAELARLFGAAGAGRARAQGQGAGEPGSPLRALHDDCLAAFAAYRACRGVA